MQYLSEQEEHTIDNLAPHGNSKRKQPYHRHIQYARQAKTIHQSLKNLKVVLDEIYSSSGDVYHA